MEYLIGIKLGAMLVLAKKKGSYFIFTYICVGGIHSLKKEAWLMNFKISGAYHRRLLIRIVF